MEIYNLINSKDVGKHCEKINHKFNTEEIAVLIYRCNTISIKEKIKLYNELIKEYPNMKLIDRIDFKHYNSVKDMIKSEITRLQTLTKMLKKDEADAIYTYNYWCKYKTKNYGIIEGKDEYRDIYKTFKEVQKLINNEIKEDEEREIINFSIRKRTTSKTQKYDIRAEYLLDENRKLKMVNIYNFEDECLYISNIGLNIPTPFKKGDLLITNSLTPFSEGYILNTYEAPFVLEHLCTWNEKIRKLLSKGKIDSSNMQGTGYLSTEEGSIYADNVFDYDSWEYFEGELEGKDKILKAISSFLKGDIGLDLLISAYDLLKNENNREKLCKFSEIMELKL